MYTPAFNFRHALAVTTALTVALPMLPARAQDASGGAPPPSRVAAISSVTGSVSFNGAGSNGQWVAATQNYPVTTNDSVFTQAGAQAALAVDSSRLTLAENTELQVTSLDQNTLAATESQGEMFLAISYLQAGQSFAITTPRGTVTINQNGNYDIAVGDQNTPTIVDVFDGAATVTDPGATLQVAAGQSGVLTGTDQTTAQLGTASQDAFVTSIMSQSAPVAAAPPSYCAPVVQHMTGVTQLASYGSWSQNSSYGAVWYPQVSADWAPYREGHWAYVQPWGYTWVDNEPWGFAPFHYGRWFQDGGRWGWAPAPNYQPSDYGADYSPVYAPALVSFFGAGVGVGISVGFGGGFGGGGVGWVPLGPNEPYYPSYGYGGNNDYFRRINYGGVRYNDINNSIHNTTIINNYNNYTNRRGATYINGDAMSRGEQVGRYGKPVPQDFLAKAQPIDFRRGQPGAGQPGGQPGGQHPQGLPQPHFQPRAAAAPHPSAFAQRRSLPPATINHQPAPNLRPGQAYNGPGQQPGGHFGGQGPQQQNHAAPNGQPAAARPGFANNPGFHPPPAPPGGGQHPGGFNPGHPAGFNQPNHPNEAQQPGRPNAPNTPRPDFANNPGFHPPPPPPGGGGQPGGGQHSLAPGNAARPNTGHEPPGHEPNVTYGGQARLEQPARPDQPLHPQPAPHPQPQQPQQLHPEAAQHPQPQVHPAQQFHPQPAPQQFHPQPQARPAEMPRPQPQQPTHVQMPQQPRPQPQQPQHQQQEQRPDQHPEQHQDQKKG